MKFHFGKKLNVFRDSSLSAVIVPNDSKKKIIVIIVVTVIAIFAVVDAILLGLVNNKAKMLFRDKEAMAESLKKISIILSKDSPKEITQSDYMNRDMLPGYTNLMLKKIDDAIKQRDTMETALKDVAEATNYVPVLTLSDTNDINVIKSRLNRLCAHTKKLFEINNKLSVFLLKVVNLATQPAITQEEFNKKIDTAADEMCSTVLECIDKNTKVVKSLEQEIVEKNSTITELKKTMEGTVSNKGEFQQVLQQKQNELTKIRDEYSKLKAQISNPGIPKNIESPSVSTEVVRTERNSYPEFYYRLKGQVMEYNSKWGFIIINFGSDSMLKTVVDGKEKEVNVPAPLGGEVYISREDKFIAKAKIANVYSLYSVANIVFPTASEVRKGDRVFFDQSNSN